MLDGGRYGLSFFFSSYSISFVISELTELNSPQAAPPPSLDFCLSTNLSSSSFCTLWVDCFLGATRESALSYYSSTMLYCTLKLVFFWLLFRYGVFPSFLKNEVYLAKSESLDMDNLSSGKFIGIFLLSPWRLASIPSSLMLLSVNFGLYIYLLGCYWGTAYCFLTNFSSLCGFNASLSYWYCWGGCFL